MRALLLILAIGCDPKPVDIEPLEPAIDPVSLARERYPNLLELQQGVISRTCSPNPGVLPRVLRINGSVPGSRMPLANQARSDDEYIAIACWIEGLTAGARADQPIDYAGCSFP